MRSILIAVLLTAPFVSAQTPNLSGVWKANPEKSKGIPAQGSYMVLMEQENGKLKETTAVTSPRGEQRTIMTYDLSGKEAQGSYQGLPLKSTATVEGGAIIVNAKQPGRTAKQTYTLSPDGNTLTVDGVMTANGKDNQRLLVLEKQPDSAGEPLRKPEQTAGEHYKNVQILKDIPTSSLIDAMRSFNMSLGVECGFCHAQGNFAADEKPTKVMARKMLTMTHTINAQNFNGNMVVRCFTCHQGHQEPQSSPAF